MEVKQWCKSLHFIRSDRWWCIMTAKIRYRMNHVAKMKWRFTFVNNFYLKNNISEAITDTVYKRGNIIPRSRSRWQTLKIKNCNEEIKIWNKLTDIRSQNFLRSKRSKMYFLAYKHGCDPFPSLHSCRFTYRDDQRGKHAHRNNCKK
jgi:hypothetical protein